MNFLVLLLRKFWKEVFQSKGLHFFFFNTKCPCSGLSASHSHANRGDMSASGEWSGNNGKDFALLCVMTDIFIVVSQ